MSDNVLIDSNVWIYAFMAQEAENEDRRITLANQLIAQTPAIILTTQIVNEVCNILLRKHRVSNQTIINYIDYFYREYPVALQEKSTIKQAATLRTQYNFAFWDSLVVASALENHCTTLYSEDMQNGVIVQNTQIINPFSQQH